MTKFNCSHCGYEVNQKTPNHCGMPMKESGESPTMGSNIELQGTAAETQNERNQASPGNSGAAASALHSSKGAVANKPPEKKGISDFNSGAPPAKYGGKGSETPAVPISANKSTGQIPNQSGSEIKKVDVKRANAKETGAQIKERAAGAEKYLPPEQAYQAGLEKDRQGAPFPLPEPDGVASSDSPDAGTYGNDAMYGKKSKNRER